MIHQMPTAPTLAHGAGPDKAAVAQFLALAGSANVFFDLVNDRLVVRAVNARWAMWQPVRACLDEIGIEAITAYFRETTPGERQNLSAVA